MSIPTSGTIGLQAVKTELSVSPSTFSLKSAEQGTYVSLNACSTYKPDGAANFSLSEWYGYNHTQACVTPTAYPRELNPYNFSSGRYQTQDILESYDGGVIAVGDFTSYTANNATTYKDYIFKFDSAYLGHAGDFGTGIQFNVAAFGIAQNPDSSLIVVGRFSSYNNTTANGIIKLTSTGIINSDDKYFYGAGSGFNGGYGGACVYVNQSDGKITVGGEFNTYRGDTVTNIVRTNPNGLIDNEFSNNCKLNAPVLSLATSSQGFYAAGKFASTQIGTSNIYHGIIRLNSNGTTDTAFNPNGGSFADTNVETYSNAWVNSIAVRSDSVVIVGGTFSKYLRAGSIVGNPNNIVALNTNGTIASVFGGGLNSYVLTVDVYPDNKILAGGWFSTLNSGVYVRGLIRYNSDYTIDTAFMNNLGRGAGGSAFDVFIVTKVKVLHTGQALVTGFFSNWNDNTNSKGIALLNYDGTLAWS